MEATIPYQRKNGNGAAKPDALSNYVFGKVQPQAIPLEEAILGALMINRDALPMVMDILQPESFYVEAHGKIYHAIVRLFERFEPVDLLTVTEELRNVGELESIGGGYYLTELSHRVASAANIEYHARIVAQRHIRRQLIESATKIVKEAYEDTTDDFDLLDRAESEFFKIGHNNAKRAAVISYLTMDVLKETEAAMLNTNDVIGISSGLRALDKEMGGWRAPDLVIVAGRPAMGKTALALKIAMGAAKAGTAVGFFSLEMSKDQLAHRMICMEGKVNGQLARNGKLTKGEFLQMQAAKPIVDALQIYIEDTAAISIGELRSLARRMKMQRGIGLLIVDYLQLMRGSERGKNREQEVAEISAGLKAIAKDLDIPVIALAQLSRAVETRGGSKRPQMSDLRESGAIENDADMVIFPYRPEYYGIETDENGNSLKGIAELIVGKNRHGRSGISVMAGFDEFYALFRDLQTSASDFPAFQPTSVPKNRENEEDIPF